MIYVKKCQPEYFEALLAGDKTFELRREEPGEPAYAVGDYIALNECETGKHCEPRYSGRCLLYRITYVLRGTPLLPERTVALGIRLMPLSRDDLWSLRDKA